MSSVPLKNQQGFLKSDNQSKANILNEQFKSVFTNENHTNFPDKGPGPFPSMTNINITEHGVYKLLKNQKPHNATDPDEVPAFILRSAAHQLAPILTQIYRHSLDIGAVPQDRRDAWVVPIFKNGEKHIAANYRPCTVMTSCDSQDRLYLKPCCASDKMLLASKCFIMLLCMICSIILHAIDVSDTGL
jgi:hypothetical protein